MSEEAWEIRKDSKTYCASTVPLCGYSAETLKSMEKAGYRLYKDGRRFYTKEKKTA